MTAPTLNGRLICASASTYGIVNGALGPDEPAPYFAGTGYLDAPGVFVGGDKDIDAVLVGTNADGVVVAFRGTLPPQLPIPLQIALDWFSDFEFAPVVKPDMPGPVHRGFYDALQFLWAGVRDEVHRRLDALGDGAKLFITGHSKGGGIAPLAAWRFHKAEGITPKVVTFAGAHCGSSQFAAAYNAEIDQDRYEFGNDIVPWLPLSEQILENIPQSLKLLPFANPFAKLQAFDYEPTGTLFYIQRDLSIISGNPDLKKQRLDSIAKAFLHVEQIIRDHSLQCGLESGYMQAVCPAGVCM